eukprot:gene2319-2859_t
MKIFVGSTKEIPLNQSIKCPEIKATDLKGNQLVFPNCLPKDQPSLLCVTLKPFQFDDFVNSWVKPFRKEFPAVPIHHVVLVHQVGYKLLGPLLKSKRVGKLPELTESWSNQAIKVTETNQVHESLSITNHFGVYVYLLKDGKIRWKSSGKASNEEIDSLLNVTSNLQTMF